ncbi:MAG: hypothetical protein R2851_06305 [Caldilineaceae bacterium]
MFDSRWGYLVAAIFLVICLVLAFGLAAWYAPNPSSASSGSRTSSTLTPPRN